MRVTENAPSWEQLEVFVYIGRAATLAQAARLLGVTPSAVSQRLSALEKQLKTALTYRSRDGVRLTDAGRHILEHCEAMATAAASIRESIRAQDQFAGLLRITCPNGLIDSVVIPALASYLEMHPHLRYEIVALNETVNLREQRMDLAIRFGWVRDGNFVARPLTTHDEVVCASPSYLKRAGMPSTPKDLLGMTGSVIADLGRRKCSHFGHRRAAVLPFKSRRAF